MLVQCDAGNWFYVMLGIAWIAYSIYKGAGKNKKQNQKAETEQKKTSFLDDFLNDFSEEETPQPVIEETVDTAKTEPEITDLFEKTLYTPTAFNTDYGETLPNNEGIPATELSKEPSSYDYELEKRKKIRRINIRKAVIYSEILNRPYK